MKKYNLFISTPIAGFKEEQEYLEFRNKMIILIDQIKQFGDVNNVYSAISEVSTMETYDSPSKSAISDLKALQASTHFIFIYPYRIISSALIELGYALAGNKKILIIVSKKADLPYMAQGFGDIREFNTTILERDINKIRIEDVLSFLNND